MRIYCSGPMTGVPDNNRPAFDAAAKHLREQGHFVINPHDFTPLFGSEDEIAESFKRYYHYLSACGDDFFISAPKKPLHEMMKVTAIARAIMQAELAALRSCDAIYLLRGWETSRGAKMELAEAIAHGLTIMQEGDAE